MKKLNTNQFIRVDEHQAAPPVYPPAMIHMEVQSPDYWYKALHLDKLEDINGLYPGLLKYVIEIESKGDPKARSSKGAKGLFQLRVKFAGNPFNPMEAAKEAAKNLGDLYKHFGNWGETLAAYNWGRHNLINNGLENIPPETEKYLTHFKNKNIPLEKTNHSVHDIDNRI